MAAICVGFGRQCITPEESTPLGGYGNTSTRMSQGAVDDLFATCIAITDEKEETVLLFTVDIIGCRRALSTPIRESITAATGIPGDHIMLSGTHTHSAPDMLNPKEPSIPRYAEFLRKQLTQCALDALEDRCEATAQIGTTRVAGLNFVRHYQLQDGSFAGDNFGDFNKSPVARHTIPADEQMQLIRFVREGKKDILAVNWQAHPSKNSTIVTPSGRANRPYISADYIHPCRKFVEENTDCHFAFYLGAAGNINSRSRIKEEDPVSDYMVYGQQLGGWVLAGMEKLRDVTTDNIQTRQQFMDAELDHTDGHLLEPATEIRKVWTETNDKARCVQMGLPYDIHSPYHAGAIMARAGRTDTFRDLELDAIRIGDISFVASPCEMFCDSAQYLKAHTPYAMTFIMTCANDHIGYIPSSPTFEHGSYEVDQRMFVRGTAEKMVDTQLAMLESMK